MGKIFRVSIALILFSLLGMSAYAVNTGSKWIMLDEEIVTINPNTSTTTTMNNTSIRDIYVALSPNQDMYYTYDTSTPTSQCFKITANSIFDTETVFARNQKVGLKAVTTTGNVVLWRYMLVQP